MALEQRGGFTGGADLNRRLQRVADEPSLAGLLELFQNRFPHLAEAVPLLDQGIPPLPLLDFREEEEMYRFLAARGGEPLVHRRVDLLAREGKDRGDEPGEGVQDPPQRGLRRPARDRVGGRGVEPVFQDIEVEGGQVHGAEMVQGPVNLVKLVLLVPLEAFPDQAPGAHQGPAVDFEHLVIGNAVGRGIEARVAGVLLVAEVAQHEAAGVADLPVRLPQAVEQLVEDADVLHVVDRTDEQARDLRPARLDQIVGVDPDPL